jgi:hypothetical protein
MNIFDSIQMYAGKWSEKSRRAFNDSEKAMVQSATVVASQYGSSVCFFMKNGSQGFIALSNDSTLKIGDTVDLEKAELVTLSRPGDADIQRVSI